MIAGIDLGTTNSLIGVMEAGFPVLLADGEGERLTPSVVGYGLGGEVMVGRRAVAVRGMGVRCVRIRLGWLGFVMGSVVYRLWRFPPRF